MSYLSLKKKNTTIGTMVEELPVQFLLQSGQSFKIPSLKSKKLENNSNAQSFSCLPLISSAARVLQIAQAIQISTISTSEKAEAFFRTIL